MATFVPADGATLKSDLAGLAKGTEIVLVGTTLYNNADSTLDTTGIGGTNYSASRIFCSQWDTLRLEYREQRPEVLTKSYYVSADIGKPYLRTPFANGLLAEDQNDNYNFHAGNNVQFQAYPNDPQRPGASSFLTASGVVSAWIPPEGSANGFWLLTLDRGTLLPIDLSNQGILPRRLLQRHLRAVLHHRQHGPERCFCRGG